jgi:enoyl-CoA hydratase
VSITQEIEDGIAQIVIDVPPVNALKADDWFALADAFDEMSDDARVAIVRAEGRGFCAGVDIKELQAHPEAIVAVNRGCAAAFAAVYECDVPVIAAVHGFCLGGGVGIVGNADIVIASRDATFGLPEVDRGALGAATHLARLVPQHRMRAMLYTGEPATADELHAYGSVLEVVGSAQVEAAARKVAETIAAKHPTIIRRAKESLNVIDPVDPRRSYRFEQGFTFELNVSGVASEVRDTFGDEDDA